MKKNTPLGIPACCAYCKKDAPVGIDAMDWMEKHWGTECPGGPLPEPFCPDPCNHVSCKSVRARRSS